MISMAAGALDWLGHHLLVPDRQKTLWRHPEYLAVTGIKVATVRGRVGIL
jgi:hypothetical protein